MSKLQHYCEKPIAVIIFTLVDFTEIPKERHDKAVKYLVPKKNPEKDSEFAREKDPEFAEILTQYQFVGSSAHLYSGLKDVFKDHELPNTIRAILMEKTAFQEIFSFSINGWLSSLTACSPKYILDTILNAIYLQQNEGCYAEALNYLQRLLADKNLKKDSGAVKMFNPYQLLYSCDEKDTHLQDTAKFCISIHNKACSIIGSPEIVDLETCAKILGISFPAQGDC